MGAGNIVLRVKALALPALFSLWHHDIPKQHQGLLLNIEPGIVPEHSQVRPQTAPRSQCPPLPTSPCIYVYIHIYTYTLTHTHTHASLALKVTLLKPSGRNVSV